MLVLIGHAWADELVCEVRVPDPIAVAWVMSDARAQLEFDATVGLELTVRLHAQLTDLEHHWTQGPYTVPESGHVVVEIEVPEEAFLDAASLDYLTLLRAGVWEAGIQRGQARRAFLAWPNGVYGDPAVWDLATGLAEAPNGILSDELRESLPDVPSTAFVRPARFTPPNREQP